MRIWDIDPGYLNRGSLLAEHRELHALVAVLDRALPGFEGQPELKRWREHRAALGQRHAQLVAEMQLRGIGHHSPFAVGPSEFVWPEHFVLAPADQFQLLRERYRTRAPGRIELPRSIIELWAQHKYSVMARDPHRAKEIGRQVGAAAVSFEALATELVGLLRQVPNPGRRLNAVQHMWGYVADFKHSQPQDEPEIFALIQRLSLQNEVSYLCASTALGELGAYLRPRCSASF